MVNKFTKSINKAVKNGTMEEDQFQTKFSSIKYDYPEGVGFGLKNNKKKRKSMSNKGKKGQKKRGTRKR
jgi:hypothetical protein